MACWVMDIMAYNTTTFLLEPVLNFSFLSHMISLYEPK